MNLQSIRSSEDISQHSAALPLQTAKRVYQSAALTSATLPLLADGEISQFEAYTHSINCKLSTNCFGKPRAISEKPILQSIECCNSNTTPQCLECANGLEGCRFIGLRGRTKGKHYTTFMDPIIHPAEDEINKWLPPAEAPSDLDIEDAWFIFGHIEKSFSEIYKEEIQAKEKWGLENQIIWKPPLNEERETCDVCKTTIFNFHFFCKECGFAVCPKCFDDRQSGQRRTFVRDVFVRDDYGWIVCPKRKNHEIGDMKLTQIIPADCLNMLNREVLKLRVMYTMPKRQEFPIKLTNVVELIDPTLWSPDSFNEDFKKESCDLVNCKTGETVPNQSMNVFWAGFKDGTKREKVDGSRMCLKLKDWPNDASFKEKSPDRFDDFIRWLPCGDYTKPDGKFNLVSRLPSGIGLKPDLGPKVYVADGFKKVSRFGTTNLHMDVSDAANIAVSVNLSNKYGKKNPKQNANKLEGALWHIFQPGCVKILRKFLSEVAAKQNMNEDSIHDDTIHSQKFYLDNQLLELLSDNYNLRPVTFIQCEGDAVFIPAGAPHQVQNINNCIKIAIDFVSPENVEKCLHLTKEFGNLCDEYENHADKLQVKNIIYHTMKDVVAVLKRKKRIRFMQDIFIYYYCHFFIFYLSQVPHI